jgi:hypothetical protein
MAYQKNYTVIDPPFALTRKVYVLDGDGEQSKLVEDTEWHSRNLERDQALFEFFVSNKLLTEREERWPDIRSLVVWLLDFTPEGQRFVESGATDRWLASFDRTPGKSPSDTRLLEGRLREMREKGRRGKGG